MSKNTNKKNGKAEPSWIWLLAAAISIFAVVVLLVWLVAGREGGVNPEKPSVTQQTTYPVKIENPEKVNINLGYGMEIVDVAKYTGVYMEDGTNEVVSGLLMIVVKNTGDQDVQFAEIEMPVEDQLAYFKMSTLPAGESMVLLEQNRMAYVDTDYTTAISKNVVLFGEPMSLCADKLKLQEKDGVINVTNISGADITGDIIIYYKNSSNDMLYGGVTYRTVIPGGMRKDEIKQIQAKHYTTSGSRIMFVTCG